MYTVYILWSNKLNKRYIGSTNNINRRLEEHNSGKSKFTSRGIPWKIIYTEKYDTLSDARKRELFLKTGAGRKLLDSIIHI